MSGIVQSSKVGVLIAGLAALLAAPTVGSAQSTDYPSQRISFIVGFAVGGFADTIGRWVAIRLGERTGQTVVVQNMEGGGGVRAARRVAMSPPDGYTILVTTTSLTINESLVPNRGYTAAAFDAVSLPVSAPESLSASVKSPIKSLADLVNEAKAGTVFMGSAGIGSGSHIAGEYFFKVLAKAPVKHIPFPGGNPAMIGLLTGDVTVLAEPAHPKRCSGSSTARSTRSSRSRRLPSASRPQACKRPFEVGLKRRRCSVRKLSTGRKW
jgi:tripartite-type tricarboxylate transporter receptor subunit TctC